MGFWGFGVLGFWKAYMSNSDGLMFFKQVFSILVFLCLEDYTNDDGAFIIEKLVKVLIKLSQSSYRNVRFPVILAIRGLFKSLLTVAKDTKRKIDADRARKKPRAQKLLKDHSLMIQGFIQSIGEHVIIPRSTDICSMFREEIYMILIDYMEKEMLDYPIAEYIDKKERIKNTESIIVNSMVDQDKSARMKGIILTEKYLSA